MGCGVAIGGRSSGGGAGRSTAHGSPTSGGPPSIGTPIPSRTRPSRSSLQAISSERAGAPDGARGRDPRELAQRKQDRLLAAKADDLGGQRLAVAAVDPHDLAERDAADGGADDEAGDLVDGAGGGGQLGEVGQWAAAAAALAPRQSSSEGAARSRRTMWPGGGGGVAVGGVLTDVSARASRPQAVAARVLRARVRSLDLRPRLVDALLHARRDLALDLAWRAFSPRSARRLRMRSSLSIRCASTRAASRLWPLMIRPDFIDQC